MSDEIKYKSDCNHVTRDIKDFGQCPNCDMHTLLNLHEITMKKLSEGNEKLEKAISALEFYADVGNWQEFNSEEYPAYFSEIIGEDIGIMGDRSKRKFLGGKLARQTLRELKECENE